MPNRRWRVDVSGKSCIVELAWSLSECSGEIRVNRKQAKAWGSRGSMSAALDFNIEESKAVFKRSGMVFEDYSLYIRNNKCGTPVD